MDRVGFVSGGAALPSVRRNTSSARCARTVTFMGAKSDKNRARNEGIVSTVKDKLSESTLAFALPMKGYTVKQISTLRKSMPEGTSMMAIKNTLFKRAVDDTDWSVATELASGSNVWVFVKEDMKASVEIIKKFNKDLKKEETNTIAGGVMEGTVYDSKGVDALSKLPSKKDLYQKIAVAIKAVPTKLGVGVKAVPTKLARAVKLAVADEEKESSE
mmetsp:Transcript_6651/g.20138  ORF Transcript_6651/g.20138 Transcript_6651/m.20138 type:complete len:216 (+) Transcript_6651:31-678(+)|eukprot:CAMPEP_0198734716 /NCGR_PEP_ID=MMETSP1475-20131203/54755_1 /TAXON_ID= ORGANISM="Unidentified sp., Strain CCMP1999" /NCGR_SAMPLE_ID=MMETSP1475 /ASSEMBLY_ACC=CAM_ASM_001111 /LENGTH=215 /DNA_ID=CAMNT_0044498245 /DNA_START=28 /DNA_END=675 /DNA_ORIENTATION=-